MAPNLENGSLMRLAYPYKLIFTISCLLASCAPKAGPAGTNGIGRPGEQGVQGETGAPGRDGTNASQNERHGTSSGGGGFVDENSTLILREASGRVARRIRLSSPDLYINLPNKFTQEKLAALIENVRYEPMLDATRNEPQKDGIGGIQGARALMFDYGVDQSGPFIKALRPFFLAYSSYPIKFSVPTVTDALYEDVMLKLLHEAAHHLGYDEVKAEKFGLQVLKSLEQDNILCETSDVGDFKFWSDYTDLKTDMVHKWIINRPMGFGVYRNSTMMELSAKEEEDILKGDLKAVTRREGVDMTILKLNFEPQSVQDGQVVLRSTGNSPSTEEVHDELLKVDTSQSGSTGTYQFTDAKKQKKTFLLKCKFNRVPINIE